MLIVSRRVRTGGASAFGPGRLWTSLRRRGRDSIDLGIRIFIAMTSATRLRHTLTLLAVLTVAACSDESETRPSAESNTALGTTRSTAAERDQPRGCPRENWPGPWTRCAEAEWVRKIVAAGGYRVTQETGSALVAANDEVTFYIWTNENAAQVLAEPDTWQRLTTIAGTPVYGDERLFRFWSAQGFIFWVKQGPTATAAPPSPTDLQPLIAASQKVRPPPP